MADPYIVGINDKHLDLKYSQLADKQRDKLIALYGDDAKKTFSEARKQRMAGQALADAELGKNEYGDPIEIRYEYDTPGYNPETGKDETYVGKDGTVTYGKDTFPDGAPIMDPTKDDIYSYDLDGYGGGHKKGKDKLSVADLKNLENQGYELQDIVDYSENITSSGNVRQGDKARNLIEKYKSQILNSTDTDTNTETNTETNTNIDTDTETDTNNTFDPGEIAIENGSIGNIIADQDQNWEQNITTTGDNNEINADVNSSNNIFAGSNTNGYNPFKFIEQLQDTVEPENTIYYGGAESSNYGNIGNIYASQDQNWSQNINTSGSNNTINAGVDSSNNIFGGNAKIMNYNPGGSNKYGYLNLYK